MLGLNEDFVNAVLLGLFLTSNDMMEYNRSNREDRERAMVIINVYYEKKLAELFEKVFEKITDFNAGKISAFDVDHALYIYHCQAKELHTWIDLFCFRFRDLPGLMAYIEQEEKGEWHWEPEFDGTPTY